MERVATALVRERSRRLLLLLLLLLSWSGSVRIIRSKSGNDSLWF